jgi:hypothetical protein
MKVIKWVVAAGAAASVALVAPTAAHAGTTWQNVKVQPVSTQSSSVVSPAGTTWQNSVVHPACVHLGC